jgi:hypothetical protein
MKQEHQPYDVHTFSSGADYDTSKELLGAQNNGKYVDSRNARVSSVSGSDGAIQKIGGEEVAYPNNLPSSDYICLVSTQVNDHYVEVWADETTALDPLIRIDGVICLQSPLFPVTVSDPPQFDVDEDCLGGLLGLTALSFTPMILNVQDMVDSLSTDPNKYFSAFNPEDYSVNLATSNDSPVFIGIVPVGGGGGLPVGLYDYSFRYVTSSGDRTNWSVATPFIPIVQSNSSASNQYPGSKTFGGPANPEFATGYGIKIRFRVTNIHNYDYIEIKRTSYNQGAGLGFTPTPEIIAKVDISREEISVRDFIDPVDSNIDPPTAISDATENQQLAYVDGAKTMRFLNKRLSLMNVRLASKESELEFSKIDGKEMHPVIENMGKAGYTDIWNFVYRKHYQSGEKFGFAIQGYDGVMGRGFAQKIDNCENIQIANRRDATSATTDLYSYGGTVKATRVDNSIGSTHEVFDLSNAESKTDLRSFKNIYQTGGLSTFGWKTQLTVNNAVTPNESSGEIENHGARVTSLPVPDLVFPYYHPYTPVSQQDPDTSGHNFISTTGVSPTNNHSSDAQIYSPKGFGPNYYSQGNLLAGISNFPSWMKSFSIARTDAAGRVVAQGIGCYSLSPAVYNFASNQSLTTKDTDKFWFFSPDIENGIISPETVNDIIANPQNYSIQFVSPLGFFSEVYNFEANAELSVRDRCVDMISYARMLRDRRGTSAEINPLEDINMGFNGGDGYNYVGYGKWRNINQQPGSFASGDMGNNEFVIRGLSRKSEGRGNYLELQINQSIYGRANVGGVTGRAFADDEMKDWTEPIYMINIVRTGAQAADGNLQQYKPVHYQKLESIIGRGTGLAGQEYKLVDERWEDCIPALTSTHPTASTDRFIYIRKPDGTEEKWMNVTFYTPLQRLAISNYIAANGAYTNGATGTYTHTNTGNREFTIVFDQSNFFPEDKSFIVVKYDNTAPIRFWGGDATIGESMFAPIDRESSAEDDASTTQFAFGISFPYGEMQLNPRHYVVARTTGGVNHIQDQDWLNLGYIRQLCMMFTVESRINTVYGYNLDYPLQYFPTVNYVMRPNRWDDSKTIAEQNIYKQYVVDYGEQEKEQWKWGGFRFLQQVNPEYSNEKKKTSFSKPEFGFIEQTHFPTREMHSLPRQINVQDAPSLRTFPANNAFDIDDKNGEIKYAYSEINEKGENLYAITDSGICLLLTSKSILSDLNGGEIAYMANTAFIGGEFWIDRKIGMKDEMWRSAAESTVPMGQDSAGAQIMMPALFFANKDSVFMLSGPQAPKNIGRANYYSKIRPILDRIQSGITTKITAHYDPKNQEYWLYINDPGTDVTDPLQICLSYSPKIGAWNGWNDMKYDRMGAFNNASRGSKNGITYDLDKGFILNGDPIQFEVIWTSAPSVFDEKEFIRVRINSDRSDKPTSVEFIDSTGNVLATMAQFIQGPNYLLRYDGWEQFIPRKADPPYDRIQDRLLQCKVIHNLATKFVLHTAGMQSKILK